MRLLRVRRLQVLGLSLKHIKGVLGVPDQERPLRVDKARFIIYAVSSNQIEAMPQESKRLAI